MNGLLVIIRNKDFRRWIVEEWGLRHIVPVAGIALASNRVFACRISRQQADVLHVGEVIRRAAGTASGFTAAALVQSVVIWTRVASFPAIAIEWFAYGYFIGRNAFIQIVGYGGIDVELTAAVCVGWVVVQWRHDAASGIPRAVVVVGHDVNPVQVLCSVGQPVVGAACIGKEAGVRAGSDRNVVALAVLLSGFIKSLAKGLQQQDVVGFVGCTLASLTRCARYANAVRIFPVDVDAIELILTQEIDGGSGEVASCDRVIRGVGELVGPRPSAYRGE